MRLVGGVVMGAACLAAGQQAASPLAGPRVVEAGEGTRSLVRHGYDGSVTRLEVPPEEAAVGLLTLDDAARAGVERVFSGRAAVLDRLVLDNLDKLIELNTAGQAGDKPRVAALAMELIAKSAPMREHGLLRDEVAAALPRESRAEYLRLVEGYWRAIGDEAKEKGKGRLGAVVQERGRLLGEAVRRSLERQIDPKGEEDFDRLIARLELRPEQETRVRHMAEEFILGARFRPTQAQEVAFIARVAAMLDAEQRGRLAAYIAERKEMGR